MWKYYNANEFGHDIADCSIRALSVAEHITWDEAYQKLCNYARNRGLMINSVESIESYLDNNYERVMTYPQETVREFAKDCNYGIYLITMAGHITVLKDGIVYDTFDCTNREIWSVWRIE